jgi:SPP1 family predicted phage head-tail adaptor
MGDVQDRGFIASLRTRLVLEAPVEKPDGVGGISRQFKPAMALWGQVTVLRASGTPVAGVPGQTLTHRVTLRWRSGVDASMRLRLGARLLAIRAAYDPGESKRTLVCLCQEVSS